MKTYHITTCITLLSLLATGARAQEEIDEVLRRVEQNNKTLVASRELLKAERVEARAGNYLANPTADVEKLWTRKNDAGYELTIKQSIDFPAAYGQRNVLARLRENTAGYRHQAARQQILLEARQTCIEIIYLRALQTLLDERLQNAERLAGAYRKKLEQGSANRLELNKILLETLDAREQARDNRSALDAARERLRALNGGIPVAFEQETFPVVREIPSLEQLQERYLATDPSIGELAGQEEIALQEVKLNRALSLPKFDLGYKRAGGGSASTSNGIVVGVSIPLFENRNKVKAARARASLATAVSEEARLDLRVSLKRLRDRLLSLDAARKDYVVVLSDLRGKELLDKALDAGQISVIEYFVELTTLHDGRRRQLEIEREYHDVLARLLRLSYPTPRD
ncbi:MAG: TolC family protein [Odoribacteraceae bacterium]|jgi:outer membrane protein TolC|nr:TolC family protein [Odoribacteraceae bacterium]